MNNTASQSMEDYFNIAREAGIDPQMEKIPLVSETAYREARAANLLLYGYLSHIMDNHQKNIGDLRFPYAFFDADGCLLKLFGNEEQLRKMDAVGLKKGQIWTMKTVGPNAVTVGLQEGKDAETRGQENYCSILQHYQIAFSPLMVNEIHAPFANRCRGGIMTIAPNDREYAGLRETAFLLAHDALTYLYLNDMFFDMYDHAAQTLLVCATSAVSGVDFIVHYTKKLYETLDIPVPKQVYYRLDELIDPLPDNQTFWNIIHEKQCVRNREMELIVQGKKKNVILSAEPHDRPAQRIFSTHIILTSPEKYTAEISSRVGYRAKLAFDDIIGESSGIKSAVLRAKMYSSSDSNIMILGESGVGKDIFAQAIHNGWGGSHKPFVAVNCGAIPRDLIASELFGYEGGAFTGAKRGGNIGKFELANGGTIFLDELGELPLELQAVLLRVVENKKLTRVGGTTEININVRVIAATNADILEMVDKKQFRADLYYRLSVLKLDIPPLRERGDDILLLAEHFMCAVARRLGLERLPVLSDGARQLMKKLPWHGNVREMQNVIERIVQIYPDSVIDVAQVLENVDLRSSEKHALLEAGIFGSDNVPDMARTELRQLGEHKYKRHKALTAAEITAALDACGENMSAAARMLNISRTTLYRNMERLGMWQGDQ